MSPEQVSERQAVWLVENDSACLLIYNLGYRNNIVHEFFIMGLVPWIH